MATNPLLWQLGDSAFPAGAFAHSAGLEAAWQAGEIANADELASWIRAALRQAGRSAMPFVTAARRGDAPLRDLDASCDSFLLNHVANRASRAQGQAMLMACARTFPSDAVRRVAREVGAAGIVGHFAPVFGALCRALEVTEGDTAELFMFLNLRGVISSAVRLGIVGPLQGQALQHRLSAYATEVAETSARIPTGDAAHVAPVADLLQGAHDRLYSRLFVS